MSDEGSNMRYEAVRVILIFPPGVVMMSFMVMEFFVYERRSDEGGV